MAVTVISKRTLARIIKEGKEVDKGTSASFSKPGKSRRKNKKVAVLDAFDVDVIRRLIHNFHVTKKTAAYFEYCIPSYSRKHQFQVRQNIFGNNFEEAGVQLFKNTFIESNLHNFCFYLKFLNNFTANVSFIWKKTRDNRQVIAERCNIRALRMVYLRAIRKYRQEGRPIIYVDETYLHSSHTTPH
jgi:hypothetical protein